MLQNNKTQAQKIVNEIINAVHVLGIIRVTLPVYWVIFGGCILFTLCRLFLLGANSTRDDLEIAYNLLADDFELDA